MVVSDRILGLAITPSAKVLLLKLASYTEVFNQAEISISTVGKELSSTQPIAKKALVELHKKGLIDVYGVKGDTDTYFVELLQLNMWEDALDESNMGTRPLNKERYHEERW